MSSRSGNASCMRAGAGLCGARNRERQNTEHMGKQPPRGKRGKAQKLGRGLERNK